MRRLYENEEYHLHILEYWFNTIGPRQGQIHPPDADPSSEDYVLWSMNSVFATVLLNVLLSLPGFQELVVDPIERIDGNFPHVHHVHSPHRIRS